MKKTIGKLNVDGNVGEGVVRRARNRDGIRRRD